MATKKLGWHRTPIMQHEYGTGRAACWAAVIESALAYYTKATTCTALAQIETKFEAAGGTVGEGGIKNFPAALKAFDIYDSHGQTSTKFAGKYKQLFGYMKLQIDKGKLVLLGFKVMDARHAGMVFGYNEPDEVFFMEPGSLAFMQDKVLHFDEKMASHYANTAVKLETLCTAQTIGTRSATERFKMEVASLYVTKPPTAAAQPPAGGVALNPYVINAAAGAPSS